MTLRGFLDRAYERYNRRELIGTDPLRFVFQYEAAEDRELVGLLASSLAFGRVEHICRSVARLLALLGEPVGVAAAARPRDLEDLLAGFRHRFVAGNDVADLLVGVARVRERWGSLNRFFVTHCYEPAIRRGGLMEEAVSAFVRALSACRKGRSFLLPRPEAGSACKRLHLYLRWMVRRDEVDPGTWQGVHERDLVVPVDTHMRRICGALGLSRRARADGRAAREITEAFGRLCPEDPVRFDFALTRIGMFGRAQEIPAHLRVGDASGHDPQVRVEWRRR